MESLLNKVGDVKACSFIKKRCFSAFMFPCKYCEMLKSTYLAEYLRAFIFQRTHVFQKQKQRNIWKSSSHVFLYLFIIIVTPVGTTLIENRLANSSFLSAPLELTILSDKISCSIILPSFNCFAYKIKENQRQEFKLCFNPVRKCLKTPCVIGLRYQEPSS